MTTLDTRLDDHDNKPQDGRPMDPDHDPDDKNWLLTLYENVVRDRPVNVLRIDAHPMVLVGVVLFLVWLAFR